MGLFCIHLRKTGLAVEELEEARELNCHDTSMGPGYSQDTIECDVTKAMSKTLWYCLYRLHRRYWRAPGYDGSHILCGLHLEY
jgi:hypothetical protein